VVECHESANGHRGDGGSDRLSSRRLSTAESSSHNDLLLEVPERELSETRDLVRDCMMNAVPLRVPLKVDFGHGKNWLEAH
jgi:DNA polymerase I-like protein with 3'-5' exonuclease and polymerase domains